MSLPQFLFKQTANNTQTTLSSLTRVVNDLYSNLQQIFTAILNKVQLDSIILSNIQLQAGVNPIPHTLGRTITGWQPIDMQGGFAQLYRTTPNLNPGTYLYLISNAPVTISLLVF